ncbi:MAG: hypothetical protein B7Z55_00735 [Planctomycetales bacterium 12-60-4]|nr:MAG: hypothetical protein B7Z55_00735 [Planctomycetales bacterium 12-60-4]
MMQQRQRKGFTLVELVVVVLVLGIIAAVAAPKMFDTATSARDNSTVQSIAVVRDAIELYKARNGVYPGDGGTSSDLHDDLKPFLKGPFPKSTLGGAPGDRSVKIETDGSALAGDVDGTTDWIYDNTTGEILINESGYETR